MNWDPCFSQSSKLFWPIATAAQRFSHSPVFPPVESWVAVLGETTPVRFEVQRPAGRRRIGPVVLDQLYDGRIIRGGVVPSRPANWHDFLNALVWATFPLSKKCLHERKFRALQSWVEPGSTRLPGRRTPELDALALFDEGGMVVVSAEPVRDRSDLSSALESGAARAAIFGHAVYESLIGQALPNPGQAIAVIVQVDRVPPSPAEQIALADRGLAARLEDPADLSVPQAFCRLPIELVPESGC